MSEYDPHYLAQQSLYGSERETYAGGSSGGGGGGPRQYGGGGGRHRGPRRSGGGGGGGGNYHGGRHDGYGRGAPYQQQQQQQQQMAPEEWHRRRLRDTLFRIGDGPRDASVGDSRSNDFHPPSELFRVKDFIEQEAAYGAAALEAIAAAFRIM